MAAIFVRGRQPPGSDAYRCPWYPLLPLVFVLAMTAILVNMFVTMRTEAVAGVAFSAAGAVLPLVPGANQRAAAGHGVMQSPWRPQDQGDFHETFDNHADPGVSGSTPVVAADVQGPNHSAKPRMYAMIEEYTLTNANGLKVELITLGAAIAELHVPDKNGKLVDVVLGFDDPAGYQSDKNQYFGCTTGRYANRIAKGKFTIDGTSIRSPPTMAPIICTAAQAESRQGGLEGRGSQIAKRGPVHVRQPRRRRRLSRQARSGRDLHVDRKERGASTTTPRQTRRRPST